MARWGGYTVNLIHYEDAASLCLAALQGRGSEGGAYYRARTFLGCDGAPVTFEARAVLRAGSGAGCWRPACAACGWAAGRLAGWLGLCGGHPLGLGSAMLPC